MNSEDIIAAFNRMFGDPYNTILCGGAAEPLYKTASSERAENEIWFRDDFASSALHEIAHWCIAGSARRRKDDYGYWYVEKRNADQQKQFEMVEARPQALEWLLSIAAGVQFRVSCDNFDLLCLDIEAQCDRIREEALKFLNDGMPERADQLLLCFAEFSGVQNAKSEHYFMDLPK